MENMLKDEQMFFQAEKGISSVRIYEWDGAWISLGKYQSVDSNEKTRQVTRPTGGKAVFHGDDLTISIAVPLTSIHCKQKDIKTAYRVLIRPIILALNQAGINADLAENTKFVRSAGKQFDCFKHISPNDVVDPRNGKKLIGCALKMSDKAVLAQCSIQVDQAKFNQLRIELEKTVATLENVATV